ncbi:RNA polymerase sigma factor, sigma-70 family [Acididesulfobacillus acetoxydans]|uniref:RNA polymerase sigma factor, sigma-70 n=1 Tax=Acididesulfobacillus acetoxydans TaxID=1561005 RepID=A0A8S0WWW0_9FIRM|nr:RNA polymerase sigma factor [Acididesulfobacillus acetoxydans]CAA7600541.1 RNA polymerase sigma factor, sigma-70 family [Acididesulfobacillus acetoxydans]CEJ06675.1 RNA polymerase sigma factor, sigma-70 [Acididesulfobacillus acetoxydans]
MTDKDLEIVLRCRSGDEEAFTDFVLHYTPYVYRTAVAFLHDRTEAEDLTQEIFLKVHRSLSQLHDLRTFPAWFKRLITNACLDHLKKKTPVPTAEFELDRAAPSGPEQWETRLVLREALAGLSLEQRQVLLLREWQGYEYREIAELMGIPLGTVKSRLFSARAHLKNVLEEEPRVRGTSTGRDR